MPIVDTILALIPAVVQAEGGIAALVDLIGALHASGQLTTEQIQRIRDDGSISDANLDAAIAAAKARIQQERK